MMVKDQEVPLTANRLFEGLSLQERDRAIAACIRKQYRRGERVFSTGDPPEFLYLLEAGHVQLVALEEDGSERILHIFRPGDIFGEILFSVERRPFDAIAMDEARIAIMSRATFLEFQRTSTKWALNFIRLLSDRLLTAEACYRTLVANPRLRRAGGRLVQACGSVARAPGRPGA